MEKRTCAVDGCEEPFSCRGWCKRHYERWRRNGDPLRVKHEVRAARTREQMDGPTKTCSKCARELPRFAFHRRKDAPDGLNYLCKDCTKLAPSVAAQRERYRSDPAYRARRRQYWADFSAARSAEWRRENGRRSKLHSLYGLTLEQFDAMNEAQGGVCAVCKRLPYGGRPDARKKYLSLDHDHQTGRHRGLLCDGCNIALGHLDDDPQRIRALLDYLLSHTP